MELCDYSLSRKTSSQLFKEGEVLRALHQVSIRGNTASLQEKNKGLWEEGGGGRDNVLKYEEVSFQYIRLDGLNHPVLKLQHIIIAKDNENFIVLFFTLHGY